MPRPVWKGHIAFGLVNVPVTLYTGEASKELHFRTLDRRDRRFYGRIETERGKAGGRQIEKEEDIQPEVPEKAGVESVRA